MLSKNQIRFLKAQAHHLHPVVLIGANGISEGVDREVNRALDSHELIKVKLGNIAEFFIWKLVYFYSGRND